MAQKDFEKIPELVFKNNLVANEGVLVIEHSKHTKLDHLQHFSSARNYGGSVFSFFELKSEE